MYTRGLPNGKPLEGSSLVHPKLTIGQFFFVLRLELMIFSTIFSTILMQEMSQLWKQNIEPIGDVLRMYEDMVGDNNYQVQAILDQIY